MLIAETIFFINSSFYCILQDLGSKFYSVCLQETCLTSLTHIARLTISRQPPQTILMLHQEVIRQMQFLSLIMFQDLHHVKLKADLVDNAKIYQVTLNRR